MTTFFYFDNGERRDGDEWNITILGKDQTIDEYRLLDYQVVNDVQIPQLKAPTKVTLAADKDGILRGVTGLSFESVHTQRLALLNNGDIAWWADPRSVRIVKADTIQSMLQGRTSFPSRTI